MTELARDLRGPAHAMRFRFPWRPYQRRVLDAVGDHLADERLHLVAAPGAGKTSLGLELFRRLRRPALVLAPTRTIRDQWIARLGDFLEEDGRPDWTSTDLDRPAFLTVVTYQALHTRTRADAASSSAGAEDDEELDERTPSSDEVRDVVDRLARAGVGTVILDEAHHLRQEWWRALSRIVDGLSDVRLVSLTATPPYDGTGREWARYEELCGPIDEEISVPELVHAGTLCPHQDFVRAVPPAPEEARAIRDHDAAVAALCDELLADPAFRAAVAAHPWLASREPDPEAVLDRPELAVALLAWRRAAGQRLPRGLLRLLDCRTRHLPRLERSWWQVLLDAYLRDRSWKLPAELRAHRKELRARLRRAGLLWRHELRIDDSRPVRTGLTLSRAKIGACAAICADERELRGDELRQVILTDFVRDEGVDAPDAGDEPLGAWPVFRALAGPADVALLTGRLAVLHESRLDALRRHADVEEARLDTLPGFVRVRCAAIGRLVRAFTALLEAGELRVLVGTRALLGEGWDAPCVNSLVLASFVGSFVTTNQMRGRAIRIDPRRPHKVASIWHLVAVEPATRLGGSDLLELERRFTTFVGLASRSAAIESGLDRLALPRIDSAAGLGELERTMAERLADLPGIAARWREAVEGASEQRVMPTVVTDRRPRYRRYHLRRTLAYLAWQSACTFFFFLGQGAHAAGSSTGRDAALLVLAGAVAVGFLLALPGFLRALFLLLRHLPVDGSVRQIALALRDALCAAESLEAPARRLKVASRVEADGTVSVTLRGASFHDQSLFADALAELLGPVRNPRYLLTRTGRFLWRRRVDFHAVPRALGVNNERATALHTAWRRRLGPSELIYTRNGDGRRQLLRARMRAFSSAFAGRTERSDRWH